MIMNTLKPNLIGHTAGVTLNGDPLQGCVYADEEAGYALVIDGYTEASLGPGKIRLASFNRDADGGPIFKGVLGKIIIDLGDGKLSGRPATGRYLRTPRELDRDTDGADEADEAAQEECLATK